MGSTSESFGIYIDAHPTIKLCGGEFPTRKDAEAYVAYLHRRELAEAKVKNQALKVMEEWTIQAAREFDLDPQDVRHDVRYGAQAAIEEVCPQG
jgi:hypothetical protein